MNIQKKQVVLEINLTTKFLNNSKKPVFSPISSFFGEKTFPPKYLTVSFTTSYRFVTPCQNLEEMNNPIPRKHKDRRTDGRAEGHACHEIFVFI